MIVRFHLVHHNFCGLKIAGRSAIYLGKNSNSKILFTLELKSFCNLIFDALSSIVVFSSAEISEQPITGKLPLKANLGSAYSAPAAGQDQFNLSIGGTDFSGIGCDRLNYPVKE